MKNCLTRLILCECYTPAADTRRKMDTLIEIERIAMEANIRTTKYIVIKQK